MNFTGKVLNKGIHAVKSLQDTKLKMMNDHDEIKIPNDDANLTILEIFPWISEFKQMCKCLLTDRSMAYLTKLMQHYLRCVNMSANKCYGKPLLMTKLKNSINETLLLFMYICRELSDDCDRYAYLNNMSDLLAVYIDMELKASRKNKGDDRKISARLTSCLYVYLEHSTEHLLDTLIKIQFMCRSYHRILDPIITKILRDIPSHPKTNEMYIRYLLIFRLWRKINTDQTVKNQITATAESSLGQPPLAYPPCLLEDVLPKVPKFQSDPVKSLLQQKFNIRKSCELFLQFCRETKNSNVGKNNENQALGPNSSKHEDNSTPKIIERVNNNLNGLIKNNLNSKPVNNILDENSKSIRKKVFNKSKDILFIDLTSEVPVEKIFKKKQCKKLAWLEEAKKRISSKIKKREKKESSLKINQQLEDSTRCENSHTVICSVGTIVSSSPDIRDNEKTETIEESSSNIEDYSNEDKQLISREMNKLNISETTTMEEEVIYCSISNGDHCDIQAELEIDTSEKDNEEIEANLSPINLSISHSIENNSKETRYMTQDSEFLEDNLSLLASVSENVPHLKAESKLKVKDYSRLKDEGFYEIFANPTSDMINRIVGVYPDDDLALNVEVTNNDQDYNKPSEQTDETSESKNTNVILNGETIVLLQKSPNSNLYIINKAKESNSGDEETNNDYQGNEYVKLEPEERMRNYPKRIELTGSQTVCNNCPVPYHLQMNSTCSCLKCTYDIVTTHCRQCIYPAADTHLPCIENNSYYQSSHSSVQAPTVQEHDQLRCQIERNFLHKEQLIDKDSDNILTHVNNKLPLKKRIRAMEYEKLLRKNDELNNYPNVPMMSIAALEPKERMINHIIITTDRQESETTTGSNNANRKVDIIKRTRSSQRKVPKVNYSYPEIDPDLISSGESKRKRRKTRR